MNPATDDLKDLRDIHLPGSVPWWPLAPGWWIVLGFTVLLAFGLAWWLWHRNGNRWRSQALQELTDLRKAYESGESDAQTVIQNLSVLLRRVAISRFPRSEVAALNGEAWLAFLDRTFKERNAFRSDNGRLLATAPYLEKAQIDVGTLGALFALTERWFKKLPRRSKP